MKKSYRVVQFAANIAILILTPLVAALVVREFAYDPPSRKESANLVSQNSTKPSVPQTAINPVGKSMPLENVDWTVNRKTLVLYLSTTCKYCNESIPFYQRLLKNKPPGVGKIITVFSQSEGEARAYLDSHRIKVDEIRTDSLRSVGVTATPTILVVNENGVVSNFWRGKLSSEKEAELTAHLAG